MRVENVPIDSVRPYGRNPRNIDGAVDAVAKSIAEFGWQQPIVVDTDNVVIVGHTRLMAAKSLGLQEVPVIVADGLTPEQVKAYRIADNKTHDASSWNFVKLSLELGDLEGFDMGGFGFSEFELSSLRGLGSDMRGLSDRKPEETSSQIVEPKLAPSKFSGGGVTQDEVQAAEVAHEGLGKRFVADHTKVNCPYCGREFEIAK